MTAQKGKDLLLKVDQTGGGSFVTIGGLRSRRLSFNAEPVDVTDSESAGRWRELLAGAGIRRAGLTGSGLFKDSTADAAVRQIFFDGDIRDWQVVIPDFGTVEGPFHIASMEYAGEHNGEVSYEITMESAGELTFTAE